MTSGSSKLLLPSGKGFDDLDAIAGGDPRLFPARARQDRLVERDGDAARLGVEPLRAQQVQDCGGLGDARRGAVDAHGDAHAGTLVGLPLALGVASLPRPAAANRPGEKPAIAASTSPVS